MSDADRKSRRTTIDATKMPFQAKQRLPHRITPSAYCSPEVFSAEIQWMRKNSWQVVATTSQVKRPGDFITCDVLGLPVVIFNFDSELVALSNVCAHRHCLIRSEPQGHANELSCQYHGWCYGSDGLTRKIPSAKDFAPIARDSFQLPKYRCAAVGQLIFVALSDSVMPIENYLGPMKEVYETRCGDDYQVTIHDEFGYEANWKVAVENTLEAYHVQCVHPKTFRNEPGERRSDHFFDDRHSAFKTDLPFAPESRLDLFFQRSQARLVKWLGRSVTVTYEHHHAYPNLLTSFTDAITLVQSVVPVTATSSKSHIIQFGILPKKSGRLKRLFARSWGIFEAMIARKILAEDFGLLPKIQRGLSASPHVGALGRCEERISSFQKYWCDVIMSHVFTGEDI